MLSKKIALTVIAGTALLAASGAYARHDDWRHGPRVSYGHRHHDHRHYRHAPRVIVRPAPVYYYPPQAVYYAPPRPVIYGSLPLGDARLRIGLQF